MNPYQLPKIGASLYGTGYGQVSSGLRTLGSAQSSAPPSEAPQGAVPEMPNLAETDPSLLRRAADVGLGGIAAAGNLLDLPSSVLRDVATWLPGGIPAQNPFDQLLTPFTDANRTRGEDILANAGLIGSDPTDSVMTNVGRWAAGTGLEILTDPLTWMTGGIWGALKGGGKIASKAGILDRATDIASSKLDRVAGYREANQVVNLRELISSAGPASHSSVLHAYNAGLKKGAPRAASLEDLPVNILDEALGANLGFKLPYAKELFFNDLKLGPMKVSGQSIAKLGDTAGHAVRASYPVRLAASLVSPALRNVKEFVNQVAASKISRDVEESERIARETVLPFVDIADTAGWFKGDQAITNSNLFYDYLEGVADSSALSSLGRGGKSVADAVNDIPEAALKGQGLLDEIDAVQGVPTMITASMRAAAKDLNVPIGRRDKPQEVIDRIRSAVDSEVETARIINGDPTPLVDNMLEIQKQLRDRAEEASTKTGVLGGTGIKVKVFDPESKKALVHPDNPLLALADPKTGMAEIPSPVRYFTRVAQMDGGAAWGKAGGRRFPQSDRFGIEREDPYRIYAYSDINNISIDPEVAGIFDKGQFGARDKLRAFFHGAPDTGVLGSTPVTDERYQKAYKLFRTKLDPYKRIDPDMLKGLDGAPIKELERAIEKRHRDLFKRISERNRDEVLKKQTLYINDPTEALLARAESGMANAAVVEGTRRLVSSLAKLRADSPFVDSGIARTGRETGSAFTPMYKEGQVSAISSWKKLDAPQRGATETFLSPDEAFTINNADGVFTATQKHTKGFFKETQLINEWSSLEDAVKGVARIQVSDISSWKKLDVPSEGATETFLSPDEAFTINNADGVFTATQKHTKGFFKETTLINEWSSLEDAVKGVARTYAKKPQSTVLRFDPSKSRYHQLFADRLDNLHKQKHLDSDELTFLKEAFAESDLDKQMTGIKFADELPWGAGGIAEWKFAGLDEFGKTRRVDFNVRISKSLAKNQKVRTILHELGHISLESMPGDVRDFAKSSIRGWLESPEGIKHFRDLYGSKKIKDTSSLGAIGDFRATEDYGISTPEWMTDSIKTLADYFLSDPEEAFAQLFAEHVAGKLVTKSPGLKRILDDVWSKLTEILARLFTGDRSSRNSKIVNEIMDYAAGFTGRDELFRKAGDIELRLASNSSVSSQEAASVFFKSPAYSKFMLNGLHGSSKHSIAELVDMAKVGDPKKLENLLKRELKASASERRALIKLLVNEDTEFAKSLVQRKASEVVESSSTQANLPRAFDALSSKLRSIRNPDKVLTPKQIEAAAAGRNTDAASLPDFIRAAGMDWDKGKTALVRELGEPASRVQSQITAAKQTDEANALSSLLADSGVDMTPDSIIADLADPDTARALRESLLDIQHDNSTKIAKKTKALIEEDGQLTDRLFATVDEVLSEFEIDSTLGADIARMNQNYSAEEEVGAIMSAFDTFTSFWKGNVTAPFPSFHARNAFGGFVQNLMNGVFDPSVSGPARYAKPYKDAWALLRGDKEIKGISNIEYFKQQGLSDREATKQLRYMISSLKLVDSPGEHQSLVGATQKVSDKLFGKRTIREKFAKPEGSTFWQRSNPLNVQSIKGEDLWTPIRIGRQVADTTESMLRGSAFIAFLRQGIDPVEAVARANRIHVDYSNLTRAERKIARRAVPFYSFQKGMTSYVASELAGRPGGPVSMSLRASANASGNDPGAPSHIRASFNVPLRTLPDGSKQYFVGADLMHEPPVEMLGTNVGETLFNMASMMHPIPKAVIERTTNASLFQEGPYGGGRSLDSLDPLLGRVLSNVGNTLGLTDRKSPVKISSSTIPEQVISNSPASRYLTEIRRLFDPRTDMVTKGLQAFTGARFATIAPEAQDAVLREQIENLMREAGGRSWQHTFMPENILESMQGDELQRVLEYQKLLRQINQRQQFRKKAAAPN